MTTYYNLTVEVRNCGTIPPLPLPLYGKVLKYLNTVTTVSLLCFTFVTLLSVYKGDLLFVRKCQVVFLY